MPRSITNKEEPIDKVFFAKTPDRLPIVRIAKIEINGFKSVEHGEIILDCGRQSQCNSYEAQSDILGIYGQNGSGKTSLIEAIRILSTTMKGGELNRVAYPDWISLKSGIATLAFTFNLHYDDGEKRIVEYKFSLKKKELSEEELNERLQDIRGERTRIDHLLMRDERLRYRISVFDETIRMTRIKDGQKARTENIITTTSDSIPFGPKKRLQEAAKGFKELEIVLKYIQDEAAKKSKSFLFNEETLNMLYDKGKLPTVYCETIFALRHFARERLRVIDTRDLDISISLPIYEKESWFYAPVAIDNEISARMLEEKNKLFSNMSLVLNQLVPGLTIGLKKMSDRPSKSSDGEQFFAVRAVAYRDGTEIPLRDESDGILKIISILNLIIAAYNDESITIAIDEFDAGIFEYLLGEILQSFEESGKGQFIFTSHNLRPLEVIDKKFIVFTTTNPNNRYYRFKDVAATNNLRDKYFREIILGEQDEELYNRTKRFEIESALMDAYDNGNEK